MEKTLLSDGESDTYLDLILDKDGSGAVIVGDKYASSTFYYHEGEWGFFSASSIHRNVCSGSKIF